MLLLLVGKIELRLTYCQLRSGYLASEQRSKSEVGEQLSQESLSQEIFTNTPFKL